ncbi:MAG: ABC transporter ATP-binding protein [Blautia sp.]|nr:ABC transporter ATP-binding protein [Blautia sp.]
MKPALPEEGKLTEQNRRVMIDLKDITKEYRLGQIGYGTLNRDLQSWWARFRHKPDPNLKLGREQRLEGDLLRALNGVDLTVFQGECVGIIGGNGAGKSTLLKLISRVAMPTSGSIDLYGRVTSMLEVGTGFHGEMTGRENIYLNGAILGMSRTEIDRKIEQIIDFSEVRDFIDTPVKRYSSGMYVKLAFSVAAHLDSEIVIMDEVLAVGDAAFQKKCIERMRTAARDENRTVLYVSHNMATVRDLCDRCIVLSEGKIIYDGDTERAIEYYNAFFLSSNNNRGGRLGNIVRRDKNLSGLVKMTDLEVRNETLYTDDILTFQLCMDSKADLDNAMLRILVSNGPGEILGMSFSEPFTLKEGNNRYTFSFPVAPLMTGGYVCDLVLVSFDGKVQIRHDFLAKILNFRIENKELYFGSKWTRRNWGSIKLSGIKIEGAECDGREE